jgi:hypothetical protein
MYEEETNILQLRLKFTVLGLPTNWNQPGATVGSYDVDSTTLFSYIFVKNGLQYDITDDLFPCASGTQWKFNVLPYNADPKINGNGCFSGTILLKSDDYPDSLTFVEFGTNLQHDTLIFNTTYRYVRASSNHDYYGFDTTIAEGDRITPTYYYYILTDPLMCFNEGTQLLSKVKLSKYHSVSVYQKVEHLKVGDFLKTHLHGYRKIKRILRGVSENKDATKTQNSMCVMKKRGDMSADLYMTGGHSLMVDKLEPDEAEKQKEMGFSERVDDKHLLLAMVSPLFEAAPPGNYPHYHFLLENDGVKTTRYGVWANGVLCETPSELYLN